MIYVNIPLTRGTRKLVLLFVCQQDIHYHTCNGCHTYNFLSRPRINPPPPPPPSNDREDLTATIPRTRPPPPPSRGPQQSIRTAPPPPNRAPPTRSGTSSDGK